MFPANTELLVSDLQFNSIKNNIKNFIKNKTEFADYDFEGSTLNYMIDILAYNTYMNSFYTNMALNETYLDTAQIRSNVVSNAKKLGYVPRSASSAVAEILLTFTPNDSPAQIKIPKNTKFSSTKNGILYNFTTIADSVLTPTLGTYAKTIEIYEGEFLTQTYTYSTTKTYYEILDKNIDISTLTVGIKPNSSSNDITYYSLVTDLVNVDANSEVFYLQENSDEKFEIYFGNGVLGKALENGNVIILTYVTCNGDYGNDIASFKTVGYSGENINDSSVKYNAKVTVQSRSTNGREKEKIDSIRFNAPNFYSAQNRLVTVKDYENFIQAKYPYIQSVSVWGGEDNDPPIYGRVILSLKPFEGYALQSATKEAIITEMKRKNVVSIEPFIVDPLFTFINPTIIITYDSTRTVKTSDEIYTSVSAAIQNYEEVYLSSFGNSFYYSNFIQTIDSADNSILGNDTRIKLEKRIVPIYNSTVSYTLKFENAVDHQYDGYLGALTSTGFETNTTTETLFLEDDGFGILRSYYFQDDGTKKIFKANVGTINYDSGEVKLNSFYFTGLEDDVAEFKVYIAPKERNYTQQKNVIFLLSNPLLQIRNSKNSQIVKSGIIDVNGNITPIQSSSVTGLIQV